MRDLLVSLSNEALALIYRGNAYFVQTLFDDPAMLAFAFC